MCEYFPVSHVNADVAQIVMLSDEVQFEESWPRMLLGRVSQSGGGLTDSSGWRSRCCCCCVGCWCWSWLCAENARRSVHDQVVSAQVIMVMMTQICTWQQIDRLLLRGHLRLQRIGHVVVGGRSTRCGSCGSSCGARTSPNGASLVGEIQDGQYGFDGRITSVLLMSVISVSASASQTLLEQVGNFEMNSQTSYNDFNNEIWTKCCWFLILIVSLSSSSSSSFHLHSSCVHTHK